MIIVLYSITSVLHKFSLSAKISVGVDFIENSPYLTSRCFSGSVGEQECALSCLIFY